MGEKGKETIAEALQRAYIPCSNGFTDVSTAWLYITTEQNITDWNKVT
jgi:hypothetical protein